MSVSEDAITVRLCEARASFIYTVWFDGDIERTKEVSLKVNGALDEGKYFGGSDVMD